MSRRFLRFHDVAEDTQDSANTAKQHFKLATWVVDEVRHQNPGVSSLLNILDKLLMKDGVFFLHWQ